jgi:hypothetical protein
MVTCFHAAEMILRGWPLADSALTAALSQPVQTLKGVLNVDHIPPLVFMEHLVPLSNGREGIIELARAVVAKIGGREQAEQRGRRYADLLEEIVAPFRIELTRLDEKFPIAKDRFQEQWTRHAESLRAGVNNWTEPAFFAKESEVILIHAVTGGGGAAQPRYRSARIEAVAQDPDPALPEVLRLAWMVSCLNLILPRYTDRLPTVQRTLAVGARAMIPVMLKVASELKLAANDQATMQLAARMWLPDPEANLATKLSEWWAVYQDTKPKWYMALAALDRVLQQPN